MRLGDILSELREDKGLTQQELADILHISNSTVSAYELGNRIPNAEMLVELSRFFDIPTDYLLGLTPSPTSLSKLEEPYVEGRSLLSVLERMRKLLPEQRELLLGVLDNMVLYAMVLEETKQKRSRAK